MGKQYNQKPKYRKHLTTGIAYTRPRINKEIGEYPKPICPGFNFILDMLLNIPSLEHDDERLMEPMAASNDFL